MKTSFRCVKPEMLVVVKTSLAWLQEAGESREEDAAENMDFILSASVLFVLINEHRMDLPLRTFVNDFFLILKYKTIFCYR